MKEFQLIDAVLGALGGAATGEGIRLGPGDDCAVAAVPAGMEVASSIDALVAGVHFPAAAAAALVGYRAIMVCASDLAAMGAAPGFALVAVTLEQDDADWLTQLASGMREAANEMSLPLVGGNLARGPRSVTVSVHGWVPAGAALVRSGARVGDGVFVTGPLGGAAAALARGDLERPRCPAELDDLACAYYRPRARFDAGLALRGRASAAIDLSDGLVQDLGHLCAASGVGADLESAELPVASGASLEQALGGGDDYELCFTAPSTPALPGVRRIGEVTATPGVRIDGRTAGEGYQHFRG